MMSISIITDTIIFSKVFKQTRKLLADSAEKLVTITLVCYSMFKMEKGIMMFVKGGYPPGKEEGHETFWVVGISFGT